LHTQIPRIQKKHLRWMGRQSLVPIGDLRLRMESWKFVNNYVNKFRDLMINRVNCEAV
jgi:hypothetical protein